MERMLGGENKLRRRLLVLTTTFPRWKDDTTPAFIYELCRELSNEDMYVVVLAPHHWQAELREDMESLRVYRFPYFYPKRYQRLCYNGGILANIKRSLLARLQAPLLIFAEIYYALKICKKEKIDVVHSHWILPSGFVGAVCKKILGTRHILTLHGADLFALERLPLKKQKTGFIIRNCDQITVVSSHIKERLLALLPSDLKEEVERKLSVIPMGVYTSLFQNKVDIEELKAKYGIQAKLVLLYIGRLVEKKGVSYLIKAMPEIVSHNKNVVLIVCGDGPLGNNLKALSEELRLQDFIRFAGYVSGEKKRDYLALSDILIVPSIVTESGDTEGLPVVIQEGMAAGKPIVASDVGGTHDSIKNGWNGFLIEQKKPDGIAAKVLELMNNKELRSGISKIAIEDSKNYDWAVIGEKYRTVMKD